MVWHASLPRRIRASASLALVVAAWPDGRPGPGIIPVSGEVLAVGVEDGTLLLDGDRGGAPCPSPGGRDPALSVAGRALACADPPG
jgi:hypothetical protein